MERSISATKERSGYLYVRHVNASTSSIPSNNRVNGTTMGDIVDTNRPYGQINSAVLWRGQSQQRRNEADIYMLGT